MPDRTQSLAFRLILFFCLLFGLALAARATTITVGTAVIPNIQSGAGTYELRIWLDRTMVDSAGVTYPVGAVDSPTNFKRVSCSLAGTTVTCLTFTLASTIDAQEGAQAKYTAKLYRNNAPLLLYNKPFALPASLGASVTWEQIWRYNNTVPNRVLDSEYYTKNQVNALYAGSIFANPATTTSRGVGKSSMNVADPVFVETTDPRVPTQDENDAMVGTSGTASASNKYVTSADSRLSISPGSSLAGYRLLASNYVLSTTSSSAVASAGVRDPVDKELSFTLGTGGSLSNGGVYVMFTYTNASGETIASNVRAAGTYANCTLVIPSPPAVTGATGWNFYATNIASAYTTARKQNGSPIAIGTGFTYDTYSGAGATLPASNTTGGSATVTVVDGSLLFAPVDSASNYTATVRQGVLVDEGTAQEEYVYVMAKPSSATFTAVFSKTHSAGFTVKSATGGIQEAIMSLPAFPSSPFTTGGKGGTVIIPPYTVIKAPIQLRRGTRLESDAVPAPLSDLGGFRFGGVIRFNSTDAGVGAVMTFGLSTEFQLKNIGVWSNTNAFYAQGAAGAVGNTIIDGCLLYGNFGQTVHGAVGFRASAGTFYLRITNSTLVGSPAVWIYGQFLNSTTIEHCLVVPQRDAADPTYMAEGIVVTANGGSPHGFSGGGFIRIRDVTTENGNGALLNLTDVNFDVEQFDVADWSPNNAVPQPQMKIMMTEGYAVSTARLSRVVFTQTPNLPAWTSQATIQSYAASAPYSTTNKYPTTALDEVTVSQIGPAVDAIAITGLTITRSRNWSLAASSGSPGSIVNAPSAGVVGWGNLASGQNNFDGLLYHTGLNGLKVNGLKGLSATSTLSNNLRGTVTLSGGTAAVTFGTAEPDASYYLALSGSANETFRWSSKGTGGFTVTSSNAGSTATVDWVLIR